MARPTGIYNLQAHGTTQTERPQYKPQSSIWTFYIKCILYGHVLKEDETEVQINKAKPDVKPKGGPKIT